MIMFKMPLTEWYFFGKWAESGSWSITSRKEQEHIVRFGIVTQDRNSCRIYSFFLGPITFGFTSLKDVK